MNIVIMILLYLISTGCYLFIYMMSTLGWHRHNFETNKSRFDYKGHFHAFKSVIIPLTIALIMIYVLIPVVFL
jgi:hypothetical protein